MRWLLLSSACTLLLAGCGPDTRTLPPRQDSGPGIDAGTLPDADAAVSDGSVSDGSVDLCGDGTRAGDEECDGADLGGATCTSLGFGAGTLRCDATCRHDASSCEGCVRDCEGRSCGSDGCGGTCGECEAGLSCNASGRCECVPVCAGRSCGSDGCGGSCGSCAAGEVCGAGNVCECVPSCAGRECGGDGCGGSCGSCAAGEACDASGACVCVPNCSGRDCGGDGCGGSCGTCTSPSACNAAGQCVCTPSCTGRMCGPDGCGGSCGTCASGSVCSAAGTCVCTPSCGGRMCGPDGCGGACGTCGAGSVCNAAGACVAASSALRLTEVFYDAVGTDDMLEWVEIMNTSTAAVSLSGFSLGSGGSSYASSTFQLSGTIPAGGCIVVGGPLSTSGNSFPTFQRAADFAPDLENADSAADGVALFGVAASAITTTTVPLDVVIYGTANTNGLIDETGAAGAVDVADTSIGGQSLERTLTGWRVQSTPSPNDCAHAR